MNWNRFWQSYPRRAADLDKFQQVGKTVGGEAICDDVFKVIIDDIVEKLDLKKTDRLLDLCCGNGLISEALASKVEVIVGIDISKPLIKTANQTSYNDNVKYICYDVKDLKSFSDEYSGYFTKVLCYEALSFFEEKDFDNILKSLENITEPNSKYFFGSVLDYKKKYNFFNTIKSKFLLLKIIITGKDFGLGNWWKDFSIRNICKKNKIFHIKFDQDKRLHTSHYRSDHLLKK